MTDIIRIGPIHANHSLLQVWIFYITQWETKSNSVWFSYWFARQGCVVLYILQPFTLTLGRFFEVHTKRKNVLPVLFKENEAGTHRTCVILNSYQWTELPFKMSVKSQLIFFATTEQFIRILFLIATRKHGSAYSIFFPLCAHLTHFIFTSETSIWSHLYNTHKTCMYRSPVIHYFPWYASAHPQTQKQMI